MKKRFDAVEFQRKVREELSKEYWADPKAFVRQLQERYGHLQKQNRGANTN